MTKLILVIGPTKAGSTWLWGVFRQLECSLPRFEKEIFFFDLNFAHGPDWYFNQFERMGSVYCDVAPTLFCKVDEVAPRISQTFDDCVVLILMRDPIERAKSDYYHFLKTGRCKKGLLDAVIKFPEIIEQSRYSEYVRLWRHYFPVELVDFDHIKNSPEHVIKRVAEITGADATQIDPPGKVNETKMIAGPGYGFIRTQVSLYLTKRSLWRLKRVLRLFDDALFRLFSGLAREGSVDFSLSEEEENWLEEKLKDEVDWYEYREGRERE